MAKIALQGIEGSYSYEAMLQLYGPKPYVCYETFEAVFESVMTGQCQLGILPIENSSTGSISAVYDLLNQYDAQIVAETTLRINHNLMATEPISPSEIEVVYSHQQGFDQCQTFFKKYDNMHRIPFKNTALSAQKVAQEKKRNQAAVASTLAAKQFGLHIIEENINDQVNNFTRFIIVSKEVILNPKANKISFQSVVNHTPGSLYKMLSCFETEHINLLKIESRPIRNKTWEYTFYIDFEGNLENESTLKALDHIKHYSNAFKLLGNYKMGEPV